MKTKVKQIVAVAFLALITLVSNAYAKGTEKSASSHESIEEALEIENWMVADNYWNTGDVFMIETINEENLELEGWMTDENNWNTENNTVVETETENALEIEPWMISENIWNR